MVKYAYGPPRGLDGINRMNIKLAENFRAVFYAPFYATYALGLYNDEGVSVTLLDSASPGNGIADMVAGKIDAVWGGPLRVIKDRDQNAACGSSLVSFCQVVGKDPFYLVGKGSAGKFDLADLPRLRFASVSEVPTPWLCLQQDLRDISVDPDIMNRIGDRTMRENVQSLVEGTIDVAQLFEPFVSNAIGQGAGQVLHTASQRGFTAYTTFIATRDGLAKNRPAFEAMTRAVESFGEWLGEHGPAELARVVAPFYPSLAHDTLVSAMTRYDDAGIWTCNRHVSRRGFERLRESMYKGGFIATTPDYDDCIADFSAESAP